MKSLSKIIRSPRGTLNEFDFGDFKIKRMFVVSNVPPGSTRGYHAHKKTTQYLCCINGSIEVTLDDGKKRSKYLLNKSEYLYQQELIWAEITFLTENAELLTVCSTKHDENDYIRDYEEFKKWKNC